MDSPLTPSPAELLSRARTDLRLGVPVVIAGRSPVMAIAVEGLSTDRLAALRARGPLTLALTRRRGETLKARVYDGDVLRIAVPDGAKLDWITALADPAQDLRHPMKGPVTEMREGDPGPARTALALAKSAQLLPAVLLTSCDPAVASALRLTAIDPADVVAPGLPQDVSAARLPMALAGEGRLHIFRDPGSAEEHYAVEIGTPARNTPVLSRLHSACFTGDVLGSLKCDCGPQLHAALAQMHEAGAGVLLYLNQEGRGIGLANKMRAYDLQDQGFDTVEANHRLGFEDDERDFQLGARLLKRLGFSAVRLLTNNPAKIARMEEAGVTVAERVPLQVGRNDQNDAYLRTKAQKSGHLL